jgi:hypothetical protein
MVAAHRIDEAAVMRSSWTSLIARPPSLRILAFRKRESDGEGFGGQSMEPGLLLGEAPFDELTFQLR